MKLFDFILEGKGHPDKIEKLDDAIKSMTWRFDPPIEVKLTIDDLGENKYHVYAENEYGIDYIPLGESIEKSFFKKLEIAIKERIQPCYPDVPFKTLLEISKKQVYYSPNYRYLIQPFNAKMEFLVDILYPNGKQYSMSAGINIKDNLQKN